MIHVIPTNDLEPHTQDTTCKCEPQVETQFNELLVVHRSFDGRESVEEAEQILTANTDMSMTKLTVIIEKEGHKTLRHTLESNERSVRLHLQEFTGFTLPKSNSKASPVLYKFNFDNPEEPTIIQCDQ